MVVPNTGPFNCLIRNLLKPVRLDSYTRIGYSAVAYYKRLDFFKIATVRRTFKGHYLARMLSLLFRTLTATKSSRPEAAQSPFCRLSSKPASRDTSTLIWQRWTYQEKTGE